MYPDASSNGLGVYARSTTPGVPHTHSGTDGVQGGAASASVTSAAVAAWQLTSALADPALFPI